MRPRLVAVAHGTRNAHGPRTIRSLVGRVARRLPGVEVVESYVELAEPAFEAVMETAQEPSVVVPLLLSTGYHVNHDLPEAARASDHPVAMTPPLGPHPLLAAATAMQLRVAGATRGDAVVLVVAGSRDPDALVDTAVAGHLLRAHWGSAVGVAHLSGAGPGVGEVVERLRSEGHRRVVAAPYLLAPGHFLTRAQSLAAEHGVRVVSDVLGPHPLVAEVVARRYLAVTRGAAGAGVRFGAPRRARVA